MSSVLVLPFHQDERLGSADIPLPDDVTHTVMRPTLPAGDRWTRLVALYDQLADRVAADVAGGGGVTGVVSGDCLAMLGTLAGAQRAGIDPSVVWFDAHGDVHTLASSTSGYLGGTALRMALGGDADRLATPLGLVPPAQDRVVLVDARDLDPAEVDYLGTSRIRRRSVHDIGPDDLPAGPAVVHVDVDVIDCAEVPGLRFPVPAGPSKAAVLDAVRRLLASGRIAVFDVSCPWWESADDEQQQVRRSLLADLLETVPVPPGG